MEKNSSKSYYDRMVEVEKYVDSEQVYKTLTPKRKVSNLIRQLKLYCEKRDSASRYYSLHKKNPIYATRIENAEFDEMLSRARFVKLISVMNDYEFDLLFIHLRMMIQEASIEKDLNKKLKLYDYVSCASALIKVDNERVMSQMAHFKNEALQLIKDVPTM